LVAEEHAVGAQVWVLTVPPVSTSTDAWLTTGNQTTASSNTNRVAVNTAIRNGTIPADKYIEFSGALESTQDSGIWNALGTSTVSGTITTTGSSVTTIGVNQTLTASSLIMKTIRMTSGSSSGQYGIIISNTTSSVTLLTSNLPTGVSANFTSVASGDSYEIHDAYTDDGIHPVYYEMATLASLLSTPLANFTN
jgi:hypothetical protein